MKQQTTRFYTVALSLVQANTMEITSSLGEILFAVYAHIQWNEEKKIQQIKETKERMNRKPTKNYNEERKKMNGKKELSKRPIT